MSSAQRRGQFITLEGGEGVGKSTNLAYVCDFLRARNIPFQVTREPGGTPLAEQVRELLLARREAEDVDPLTEVLLVFAARAQHIRQVIQPALANGEWVVCDRFTDATYAYQGGGRGLDASVIGQLERLVQGDFRPDATILLDVPVATGMSRARGRGELDRFELEKNRFFEAVRSCYLARAAAEPQRFYLIDASPELGIVQSALDRALHSITGRIAGGRSG